VNSAQTGQSRPYSLALAWATFQVMVFKTFKVGPLFSSGEGRQAAVVDEPQRLVSLYLTVRVHKVVWPKSIVAQIR
jgi:hypothetical protein